MRARVGQAPACRLAQYVFVALSLLTAFGCGGNPADRVVVTGEVTFAGRQVSNGDIRFLPLAGETGRATGAAIVDGRYTVDAGGGVPIGEHEIKIRAFLLEGVGSAPKQAADADIFSAPPAAAPSADALPKYISDGRENYLPLKYNAESQLRATVDGKTDPWTLDFTLE